MKVGKRAGVMEIGKPSLRRYSWAIVKSALRIYLLLALVVFCSQRWLIYPTPRDVTIPASPRGQLLTLEGHDHRRVHALYVPAQGRQPTVVLFHGNAEQLADQVPVVEDLADSHFGVYAVEYPGYGLSKDNRTTEGWVYADAEVALQHLEVQLKVARERMVLLGRSMGTGVAAEMASRGYGSRLILLSPFTSMGDLAAKSFPYLPTRWLVLDHYDTVAKAQRIRQPTLVVHGSRDSVVPTDMGRIVAARIPKATLLLIPDANHNDLFELGGTKLWQTLIDFAAN